MGGGLHGFSLEVVIDSQESPDGSERALGVSFSVILDVYESIVLFKVIKCGVWRCHGMVGVEVVIRVSNHTLFNACELIII